MEIMADSNIIVSAILFPKSNVAKVLEYIFDNHTLVLCDYIINEVKNVFLDKFPYRIDEMEIFINRIKYKLVKLEEMNISKYPKIRDVNDFPVLSTAIESNVDILITGDKDFDEIMIDKPKIIKPRIFMDEYMN
jgi:putative PIN family toxin of toxin-antitoxin system